MAVINITPEMLEAGKPWGAGWKKATLLEIKEEPSKNKDSINYKPVYEWGWASDGSNTPGRRLPDFAHLMNNKNAGMFAQQFLPFAAAIMNTSVSELNAGAFDTDKVKGTEIWLEIGEEVYNGQIQERVKGVANRSKVPF